MYWLFVHYSIHQDWNSSNDTRIYWLNDGTTASRIVFGTRPHLSFIYILL